MYASGYRCEKDGAADRHAAAALPAFIRSASAIRARFERDAEGTTRLAELYEAGAMRLRLPNAGARCKGVLINTGGGMAGGDSLAVAVELASGAAVTLTSQSAEKTYRSDGAPSRIAIDLNAAPASHLCWLPQETILFDGSSLERRLSIELAPDAVLTLLEITVFGRLARGERLGSGCVRDHWRIRRGGRLVLAESMRADGPISGLLDRPAIGSGARAMATLIHVAPDAERRLGRMRAALRRAGLECAASAWNGALVARFLSPDPMLLRQTACRAVCALTRAPMPRVWSV